MIQISQNNKSRGYISLIGGSFIQFAIGCSLSYGNLVPYFASYVTYIESHSNSQLLSRDDLIYIYNEQTMNFNLIYSLRFIAFSIGAYYSGYLENRLGPKTTLTISTFLMSLGFSSTFFALKYGGSYSFYFCFVTLGIIWNAGIGIAFPLLMIVCMRWFPDKRGFVGGFSLGLFGTGAFIFVFLESLLVNPSNIKFDQYIGCVQQPEILDRIPVMCIYIALVMAGMQTISIFCIKNPPWFRIGNLQNRKMKKPNEFERKYEEDSLNVMQAMKFSVFWILFIQTFLYVLISDVAILQWKTFAVSDLRILNDKYLSVVGSISAFGNGVGRIFWGWFYDYIGSSYRTVQSLMSIIITIFLVTWPLCSYFPLVMYPIWTIMIWMQVNCCFAIYPSFVSTMFGTKYVGSLMGFLIFAELFSGLFVAGVGSHIYSWFHGWAYYLLMIGAIGVCTVLIANVLNPNINRKQYLFEIRLKRKLTGKKRLIQYNSNANIKAYGYGIVDTEV